MKETIGFIIIGSIFTISCSMLALLACNRWLGTWACTKIGWHWEPRVKSFDGCSLHGICPRCGKEVMQDGQGSWF